MTINTDLNNFKSLSFQLVQGTPVSAAGLERLVQAKGLKISVDGKEFELLATDPGAGDCAVVRDLTADKCVIRVIVTIAGRQRFFDVTVSKRGNNAIAVSNIKEASTRAP